MAISPQNIPVFILAGGLGTRLSEETRLRPKPMVEIGGVPILVHIMRYYHGFGFNDFVVCAGYRAWEIKQFFLTYSYRMNDLDIDTRPSASGGAPKTLGHNEKEERWRVRVIDAGVETQTGGRIARCLDVIAGKQDFPHFALTYGDGLTDAHLGRELEFHLEHGRTGTVLGVHPRARFGELDYDPDNRVREFLEKPQSRQGVINGGFFLFKREFRKYLSDDESCVLELAPLAKLAKDGQLMVHPHTGFWHPMDTVRDRTLLQELWDSGKAPWAKVQK